MSETKAFDELLEQAQEQDAVEKGEAVDITGLLWTGDECPEDECEKHVRQRSHPRTDSIGIPRNPEAPTREMVCTVHGIVSHN
jgi:hypothetical protein